MSSIRQIAKLAGVCPTTVLLALRDSPEISEHTRKKVQETAQKLNYLLPEARVPGFGNGRVIGYIIHESFGSLAAAILSGAMEEAEKFKIGFLIKQVVHDQDWIEEAIHNLLDLGVCGLVIAHAYSELLPKRILVALNSRGIHLVQLMNRVFAEPVDSVCRNERNYADMASAFFAALGHQHILGIDVSYPDACWTPAFRAHHLDISFLTGVSAGRDLPTAFQAFLEMSPRPTAIIAEMDQAAFRFMVMARLYGLDVPGDVSILGMRNAHGDYYYPDLSTIDMKARQIGKAGIRLLAGRIVAGILSLIHI